MCKISSVSIRALKRKASQLKKKIRKSDQETITFLKSNLPRFKELTRIDILEQDITTSDCLHAIAKSKGYENWQVLLNVRLDYVNKHVDDHKDFDLWTAYLHIGGVCTLKRLLSRNFLNQLNKGYREPAEKLVTDCELFIDHQEEVESKKNKDDRQLWYHFILPDDENIPAKLVVVFNLLQDFLSDNEKTILIDELSSFYSQIEGASSKLGLLSLKENEKDRKIIEIIDEVITIRSNQKTMKDCPECYCPNPIMATECNGCGREFDIISELRNGIYG